MYTRSDEDVRRRTKKPSQIEIEGDIARLTTSQGLVTVIDAADVPLLSGFAWQAVPQNDGRRHYAVRRFRSDGRVAMETLHGRLMNPPKGIEVDHADGDSLNNRRSNLRFATRAENMANKEPKRRSASGFAGVYALKQRFEARICIGSERRRLGTFDTAEEAHAAYRSAREIPDAFYVRSPARPAVCA